MSDDSKLATEARKGLLGSVAGKAKEVAGAVLGNDSMTREGQLQQAGAVERRTANSEQAVADAEAAEAAQRLRAENEKARDHSRAAAAEEARAARHATQERAQAVADAESEARIRKEHAAATTRQRTESVIQEAAADAAREQVAALAQEGAAQREHDRLLASARAAETAAARAHRDATELGAEISE